MERDLRHSAIGAPSAHSGSTPVQAVRSSTSRRCEMTRVLVVHHDLDLAGQEVDSLRRFGYEVTECSGPTRNVCPILAGRPCDLAERADVLVYDVWASGDSDGAQTLIDNIRALHPAT